MMAIFISFLAGISTLLGAIILLIKKEYNIKNISLILGLSAGIMLGISLFELIYNSYIYLNKPILIFLLIIFGLFISFSLERLININNKLERVGVISLIAIIIHNIPEGIATYITTSYDIKLGISFALLIAFHNIPEGFSIALPLYKKYKNKKLPLLYTFIAGEAEVVGTIISHIFLHNYINTIILGILFSIIAGIMIYISIFELFNMSYYYDKKFSIVWLIVGLILATINLKI